MNGWARLLPREVPPLARMALAYGELFGADLRADAATLERRIRAALLSALLGLLTAASALALVVAATWNTPYRLPALAALTAALLAGTAASIVAARSRGAERPRAFDHVRTEWARDKQLLLGFLEATPPGSDRDTRE